MGLMVLMMPGCGVYGGWTERKKDEMEKEKGKAKEERCDDLSGWEFLE